MEPTELLRAKPEVTGLFVDFDGTLSEIAPTPEEAAAVPGATDALRAAAGRFAVVAVVSGRPAAEVRAKLGDPPGVRWFGLYGLDQGETGPGDASSTALGPMIATAVADLEHIRLEPKGATFAVHYRDAPDPGSTRAVLLERLMAIADAADMRIIEGKRVVELGPADAPTKGDVIRSQGKALDVICYAGDDLADLHAFGAVDELVASGATGLKIAVASAETPAELADAADVLVSGPPALVRLIREAAEA